MHPIAPANTPALSRIGNDVIEAPITWAEPASDLLLRTVQFEHRDPAILKQQDAAVFLECHASSRRPLREETMRFGARIVCIDRAWRDIEEQQQTGFRMPQRSFAHLARYIRDEFRSTFD